MDEISQDISDFESLLKNRSTNKPLGLYAGSEHKSKHISTTVTSKLCAKEVLANVSRQVKAMQNADTVACKRVGNTLNKYKKREFLPVDKIPVYYEVPQKLPTKFETQCVSETQLINVVENAEIIDKHRGVTQEFDKTFCQKSYNDNDDKLNDGSLKSKTIYTEKCESKINISKDESVITNKLCKLNTQDSKMFDDSDLTCAMDTVTCCENDVPIGLNDDINLNLSQETEGFNKCLEIIDVSEVDTERSTSTSPVLNTIKRSATPPLVVDLYTFEKFEDFAIPIIEEQRDLKLAKSMINSQILGREISIPDHFNELVGRDSPVLSKVECITTNINEEEVEKICTCSNKCVDRDIQYINESNDENVNLGSGNKKTESAIKTEIKDEILFSSDEEYEYLHKNVQELPLTCALETSFYDRSDVLDKTMYVGFQTASNKSIQINTDSFTKAKNILSDIDNEETGKSLSDLVEIFDTDNVISVNEETTNQTPYNVEKDENNDITTPSTYTTVFKESREDTLENVSLPALERDEEVKDEIVMSQIIQCKSISRCGKLNNSVLSDRNISDTINSTALEPNKEIDNDIIMSQVIQFKSLSRTPNIHNSNVVEESLLPNTGIAKRKFEGFKTASNKKIKLSDKALARCKKVFQDIDLGDPEYASCNSDIVETEENFLDDLKSQDFNVSYDGGLITKSKIDLRNKEEQPGMKDVDLQINDKIILQEFEDNEMPFEETNNNTFVGFKTASNKNIDVSVDAVARIKHIFQDIITAPTANDCNSAMKAAENVSDDGDKNEHLFKKPTDFRNSTTNQTNPSIVTSEKLKNNDRERYNSEKFRSNQLIGFKTASHKEIFVSDQAVEKNKGIFKDIDEEVIKTVDKKDKFSLNTEKKQINNYEDDFNCGIDTQDFLAEELTRIEDLLKDNIMEKQKSTSPPIFQGFQTANNKRIVIFEEALEKSKKLLEDITYKEIDIKCYSIENKVDIDQNAVEKNLVTGIVNTDKFKGIKNETPILTGFHTASNKAVVVSKKGIEASKTLFHDIGLSQRENIVQNEEATEICGSEITNNKIDNLESKIPEPDSKAIRISETALQNRTKCTDGSTDTNTEPPTFVGFRTASAKPINISANAMEKTKKLLSEFDLNDDDIMFDKHSGQTLEAPTSFVGFQTASKKKISISAKALAKSKQMLYDLEFNNLNNNNDGHGKYIPDTSSINTEAKTIQLIDDPYQNSTNKFIGFQTASNKEVKISKEALARSKQMFQDVDLDDEECDVVEKYSRHEEKTSPVLKGFKTASNKDALVFKGFQTASNKKVAISERALAKSKKLFEDLNLSQLDKDPKSVLDMHENNFGGFQTGSNKTVKVSEQTLAKTKDMFKYIHIEKENDNFTKDSIPVFKGFQTASNKKVQISEIALAKSKRLFEDMNLSQLDKEAKLAEDIHENNFVGLQTSNNKTVKISEQAKDMFKNIHPEKENDNITTDSSPVKGFQTASNKKVKISEKPLAKSKESFEDLNLSQLNKDRNMTVREDNFGGFQTANNKQVTVSTQALAKTKEMFKNINLETDYYSNDAIKSAKHEDVTFKGFQTASNKKVVVSENALSKCKQLFEDMDLSQLSNNRKPTIDSFELLSAKANEKNESMNNHKNNFGSSQTASNKRFKVSDQALVKSKNLLKDALNENKLEYKDKEIRTPENKTYSSATKNVVNDVIDTQILNDFQEPLNTEDFCKSTPTSKRSGSPILYCPRAKKRKFETPYRTSKKMEPKNPFVPPKLAKTYNFDDNYKKRKKYTLKDVHNLEKDHTKLNINPCIEEFNFENLFDFVFKDKRNDYTSEKNTIEDVKKIFLGSVNKKIVPEGWLDNHIKLIIWKLLSYEVKFPNLMKNTCTVKNVLEQLKYRYDRELYQVQRPILRKILEKDEVASKTMVLCVAAIYVDTASVTSVNPASQNVELLLTDGWYCVKACLDRMLVRLVVTGAIVVGSKIAVCGAELLNCEQGIAPWEDTTSVRLKLHGNSTRRARWFTRLGPCTDLIQSSLSAAKPDGGKMSTRVVVTRVYPPLYVEKMDDGSTVTLSERLEQIRQMKYESERQILMEKLYEELEKEMSDQESQDSEGYSNDAGCMDSGSQICRNMKRSKDPDEYRSHLTKSQNRLLEDHNARQREKLIERVRAKFQQKLDKHGLKTDRNVVPLLKVRVAGMVEKAGKVDITKGYLSIWKPSAAVLELVTEGAWIEILNVIPTGIRNSEIQLSAGRQTIFNPYKQKIYKFKLYTNTLQRKCYEIKEISQNPAMPTDNNEIDTVGMIFCIEPSTKDFKEQSFQNVYLADADKNIICVNSWGGLKKFGFENVLDTGQIITCVNLQKRAGNTRKSIPQYRVTEFTYFTKTPKSKKALEITNELTSKLSKVKDKFCEDCLILKNNYSIFKRRDSENVSPYRFDYNLPKNMVSPLRNCDTNLNLTGLDFESSFNSQEISPRLLLRKKKVNEKIEKIRLNYGEPPPLSSIHLINKSKNASATYKSPLISNLESSKLESPGLQNVASPVTVNRTFVKNVNPVKLNFSSENLDESVDHFAEDFDASPPLSLDSDILN
ncbi:breast cancer type 2 susceptibility protein [Cydia pomonella]|uniref:breast cancer type 2 susceptibility protein n=1 Tax=Cydia pomonella TaxID=82600 RepID=UPI002ADE0A04|nr:breast cancer type 2 susceptibility protein [Cydia pomonella]